MTSNTKKVSTFTGEHLADRPQSADEPRSGLAALVGQAGEQRWGPLASDISRADDEGASREPVLGIE
jgi:hypothetical protein